MVQCGSCLSLMIGSYVDGPFPLNNVDRLVHNKVRVVVDFFLFFSQNLNIQSIYYNIIDI